MFAWCRAHVLAWLFDLRFWLWRHMSVPLPARPGWRELITAVVGTDGAYVSPDGAVGAPFEWSMYDGPTTEIITTCALTGRKIGPTTDPFGVRCARCGVPIACTVAGMNTSFDVPSCHACRSAVRRVCLSV